MVSKKLGDGETAADIIFSHRSKSYNKNVKVFRRGPEFLPQPLRVADNARPLICENLCNLQTLDLESINPSQWSEWDDRESTTWPVGWDRDPGGVFSSRASRERSRHNACSSSGSAGRSDPADCL